MRGYVTDNSNGGVGGEGNERKHDGKGAQVTDGFGDNWLVPTF